MKQYRETRLMNG
jgi:hypothetical protein